MLGFGYWCDKHRRTSSYYPNSAIIFHYSVQYWYFEPKKRTTCLLPMMMLFLQWSVCISASSSFIYDSFLSLEKQGAQPCTFYLQNGRCKFGATCKFDHPMGAMRYSPSASSLIETPVAPYPVGSLLSTLAPASSSSDLRPELISGSKKDSLLSRIPSSGNTSSSSVGLIFSQTGSVPLSDLQLSGQSSVPLSSSRSARQGVEVRRLSWCIT